MCGGGGNICRRGDSMREHDMHRMLRSGVWGVAVLTAASLVTAPAQAQGQRPKRKPGAAAPAPAPSRPAPVDLDSDNGAAPAQSNIPSADSPASPAPPPNAKKTRSADLGPAAVAGAPSEA